MLEVSCLAPGGAFDFARLACDFHRDHAHVPFALWPFWLAQAGIALGTGVVILGARRARSVSLGNPARTSRGS